MKIYKNIVDHYGKEKQIQKTIKKLALLNIALIQNDDIENIKETIVDVEIMIEQLKEIYSIKVETSLLHMEKITEIKRMMQNEVDEKEIREGMLI